MAGNQLKPISDSDLEQIWKWNATVPEKVDALVHNIFSHTAQQKPDNLAIDAWDGQLTYRELDQLSDHLAAKLRLHRVKPEVFVPVLIEKSKWAPVSVWGVMKSGGVTVLLDVSQPEERLQTIFELIRPPVMLCSNESRDLAERLGGGAAVVTVNEEQMDKLAKVSPIPKPGAPNVRPGNGLYVVFTSGSTGTPKGVVLTHANLASAMTYHAPTMKLNSKSRVLDYASYSFDMAWYNLLHTFYAGATLCVPSDKDRKHDPSSVIRNLKPNFANLTPTVADLIDDDAFAMLEGFEIAGEPCTAKLLSRIPPSQRFRIKYGPAECCPIQTSSAETPQTPDDIGYGVGATIWLVDGSGEQLAPIGETGEIWIEGPLVGRGYLRDETQTAKAFVQDPSWLVCGGPDCTSQPGRRGRLYRTGDLARYCSDGSLRIEGRRDGQVKIRGQRVELGDVEYHVWNSLDEPRRAGGLKVAATVATPKGQTSSMLIAVVAPISGADLTDCELQVELKRLTEGVDDRIAAVLPPYMIPVGYIPMRAIPLTGNGKIDRRCLNEAISRSSLQEIAAFTSSPDDIRREPATENEKTLQDLFASVLGINASSVAADDSFIRLGGDSLSAMRLAAAARAKRLSLAVSSILGKPRLCDMAEDLVLALPSNEKAATPAPFSMLKTGATEACNQAAALCNVSESTILDIFPCTPLQEGLLAMSSKQAGSYVTSVVFELPADTVLSRFRDAWDAMTQSTRILQTRIVDLSGEGLVQVVVDQLEDWGHATDLQTYLQSEKERHVGLGTALSHPGLVENSKAGKLNFVLTIHHSLNDGMSIPLLLKDVQRRFDGKEVEALVPFETFVKHISTVSSVDTSSFWTSQFSDTVASQFPELPSSTYTPQADCIVDRRLEGLNWAGRDYTASTMLKAAWALLQSRYTDTPESLFGVISSGRQASFPGAERVVGPTIATVPLRISVDGNLSTSEFLHQIQKQSLDMVPFEQAGLQNIRKVSSEAQRCCGFQTLLIVQPPDDDALAMGLWASDANLRARQGTTEYANFNTYAIMVLFNLQGADGVHVEISYDSHVVDHIQALRMLVQLEHVLRQMTSSAVSRLKSISAASEDDLDEIWKRNANIPAAPEACVHELVIETARRQPEAVAICAWDGQLTYRQLDQVSSNLATRLIHMEVGLGDIVPFCMEKSKWAHVAMIATQKAGAAWAGILPNTASVRKNAILELVDPKVIITSSKASSLFPNHQVIIADDSWWDDPEDIPNEWPKQSPSDPAAVYFTSGTTGVPKGILLQHSVILATIHYVQSRTGADTTTRIFQMGTYSFDHSLYDTYTAFVYGGCVCVPSEHDRDNNPSSAAQQLKVNYLCSTASIISTISSDLPLKTLIFSGEALRESDVERWNRLDAPKIGNWYGPTEVPQGTWGDVVPGKYKNGVLGYGIATCCWIVDRVNENVLAPIGAIGELWLEGPVVATGYLKDEVRTKETFIEDPAWLVNGKSKRRGRVYRTGDLVRYNSDGSLSYFGRKDQQTKIRGQRVELTEIEHHIRRAASDVASIEVVAEAPILYGTGTTTLVAFVRVLGSDGYQQALAQLALAIEENMRKDTPDYMIPSYYVAVERIPMAGSGKTDRRKLRDMIISLSAEEMARYRPRLDTLRAPEGGMELKIQRIWTKVLGVDRERISAVDSFFRSGGDSIAAMRAVHAARKEGLQVSVAEIFQYPKLCDLADYLDSRDQIADTTVALDKNEKQAILPFSLLAKTSEGDAKDRVASLCGIDPSKVEDVFPCTPLQAGLLALTAQREGDYVQRMVFQLRQDIDIDRFRSAWHKVAAAAPILRTRIVDLEQEGLVQVIISEGITWRIDTDLDVYTSVDRNEAMGLGTPLARFGLVHGTTASFVWTMHHALYDGISMPLMLSMLKKTYEGAGSLPATTSFQSFVKHIDSINKSGVSEIWQHDFEGLEAEHFPQLPSPMYKPIPQSELTHLIDKIQWPKSSNITAASTLRTALALLIANYTDSPDVVFGVTSTGRQIALPGVEHILGPTLTTSPVRTVINYDNDEVGQLLRRVQKHAISRVDAEHFGLQAIRQASQAAERACEFQTLLMIQPSSEDGDSADSGIFQSQFEESRDLQSFNTYALLVYCGLGKNGLQLCLNFDCTVISQIQAKRFAHQLEHILRQLCAEENSNVKIGDLHLTSPQDLQQIWDWNAKVPVPMTIGLGSSASVHLLIEATARQQPDAIAVHGWDGDLTYGELNALSTNLAYKLVEGCDIGPEVVVPLCLEKGRLMTVAILATMKAGGVCLALDVGQPEDRLSSIVGQVNPKVIIASPETTDLAGRIGTGCAVLLADDVTNEEYTRQDRPLPRVQTSNALYIVFTSGSTGTPKGVVITHGNYLAAIAFRREWMGITNKSRILDFASAAFDVFWENTLMGLSAGACLCTPSRAQRVDSLSDYIKGKCITYADITPALARAVDVSTIDTVHIGGEPFTKAHLEHLKNFKGRIMNSYGPAECTVTATTTDVILSQYEVPHIGKGIGAVTWVVSTSQPNCLAAVGGVGELYIEGPLVGRGYLNDAEKTAAAFIENPSWLARGSAAGNTARQGRLYRTGDLVRYSEEGDLVFIGRKDGQVKLNGQRVELAEVEVQVQRLLLQQEEWSSIQVIAEVVQAQENEQKSLVTFVVLSVSIASMDNMAEKVRRATTNLSDRLAETVPAYMIPAAYLPLNEVPMTATGKIDHRRLRDIAAKEFEYSQPLPSEQNITPPKTETEHTLWQIWAEVLNRDPKTLSTTMSFPRLGGDSITAMQVVSRCRARDIQVSVADMLRAKTIQRAAEYVQNNSSRSEHNGLNGAVKVNRSKFSLLDISDAAIDQLVEHQLPNVGIQSNAVAELYPCTPLQEGILLSNKTGRATYLTNCIWTCTAQDGGHVSVGKLEQAWRSVFAQHSIFSTVFIDDTETGGFIQVVRRSAMHQIRHCKSQKLSPAEFLRVTKPPEFQPGQPEVAITFAQAEDGALGCRLDMSHALVDAASIPIVLDHLDKAYRNLPLPPPSRFGDVVEYIRRIPAQIRTEYWDGFLENVQPCHFPTEELSNTSGNTGHSRVLPIDSLSIKGMYDFCRAYGITRNAFAHVAWALVLMHYTGLDDVCFGFLASGRDMPVDGVDQMVGPVINMLVSRVSVNGPTTVLDILRRTAQDSVSQLDHQHVSLAEIQRRLGVGRLINSSITVRDAREQHTAPDSDNLDGIHFIDYHSEDAHEFDISLGIDLDGPATEVVLGYRSDKIHHSTAREVASVIEAVIDYLFAQVTSSPIVSVRSDFFKHVTGVDEDGANAFWERELVGSQSSIFPSLPTPTYHPHRNAMRKLSISGSTDFTPSSPETTMLAAWGLLQAKYTGAEEVLLGVLRRPGLQTGKSPLPMRIVNDWDTTVEKFVSDVQEKASNASTYENMSLHMIRRLGEDAAEACNFQTVLIFRQMEAGFGDAIVGGEANGILRLNGKSSQPNGSAARSNGQPVAQHLTKPERRRDVDSSSDSESMTSLGPVTNNNLSSDSDSLLHGYTLVIECRLVGQSNVEVQANFDAKVLSPKLMSRMLEQLKHIFLRAMDPAFAGKRLRDIESSSSLDVQDIWKWNATIYKPVEMCVHDIFATTTRRQPTATAITSWDGQLTYAEVDDLSSRLAAHLIQKGVGSTLDTVLLLFEKSIWMAVSMLAVCKSGAAAVGMDVSQPEERLRTVATQAKARIVLCSTSSADVAVRLRPEGIDVVPVDKGRIESMNELLETGLPVVKPSKPVFIVFTSGSTGTPKGVVITHTNLASEIELQMKTTLEFSPSTRMLDFASYAFDVCWMSVVGVLCCGGTVCVPSEVQRRNNLARAMRDMRVNCAIFTPTVVKTIVDDAVIRQLNLLILGGEAVGDALIERMLKLTRVRIAYGPSEATIGVVFAEKENGDRGLGRGIGASTWIVDTQDSNQLVGIGCIGELWVDGPLVGQGYLNDPAKTSAAFIEDPPWLTASGRHGRLYKTGDLVRYHEDGTLAFVGRKDTQVKIRGQRVELEEVEHHVLSNLNCQAGVGEEVQVVADLVSPRDMARPILVGIVVPKGGETMSRADLESTVSSMVNEIHTRIGANAPRYMVPARFVALPRLPTTTTGKINRRYLHALCGEFTLENMIDPASTSTPHREPSTQAEKQVQQLWASVLGISAAGISADSEFMTLGGDSIIAMRLVAAARKQKLFLSVADIFTHTKLSDLAKRIKRESLYEETMKPFTLLRSTEPGSARKHAAKLCGVNEESIEDVYPCTPLQEGLLAMTARQEGDYVWRNQLILQPGIDQERFKRAWETVVASTPILRTRIVDMQQEGLVQVTLFKSVVWRSYDSLSESEEPEQRDSMGLGTPLCHVGFYISSDGSTYFMWALHHSLYDGWSMPLILDAIKRAYWTTSPSLQLISFQPFIKHVLSSSRAEAAERFWTEQFTGLEAQRFPALPSTGYRPRAKTMLKHKIATKMSPPSGTTLQTVLRTAWALVIAQRTGSAEAVFGAIVTGRQASVPDIERIVGPTLATVPIRVCIDNVGTLKTLLQCVQRQSAQMIQFEQTGLQRIHKMSAEALEACSFQSLLVVNVETRESSEIDGTKELFTEKSDSGSGGLINEAFSTYALTVVCDQSNDEALTISLSIDDEVVDTSQAKRLAGQLEYVLTLICTSEPQELDMAIQHIPLASDADLHDIWRWNAEVPAPVQMRVDQLFADVVKLHPHAPAVCAWNGELTFQQLDELSTRLAGHLSRLGAGPETIIPLCFEKGMYMPIAMFGVIKAGAASVGLDVNQPEQRLESILRQVKPKVILCSAESAARVSSIVGQDVVKVVVSDVCLLDLPLEELKASKATPDSILYVVFTSGSTGEPKGVTITHSNVCSAIQLQVETLEIVPGSRLLDFASYAFDATWATNVMAVCKGACVCVPSEDQRQNRLSQAMEELRVTSATFTPTLAETLDMSTLRNLRFLEVGGESVSDAFVKKVPTRVRVAYGPSECTIGVVFAKRDQGETGIGRGSGACTWIIDPIAPERGPVGVGCVGELWIEGPLVGPGYLEQPEKTAAVFIENPPWLQKGTNGRKGRLYRTGDLVRYAEDGCIQFVGRIDAQVKIRGQRVELAEVEHHILEQFRGESGQGEKAYVVAELVIPKGIKNPMLVAFIVPRTQHGTEDYASVVVQLVQSVHGKVAAAAPSYMVPTAYVPLSALPTTITGKTNRRQLRQIAAGMTMNQLIHPSNRSYGGHRAPATPAEKLLQQLWAGLLGVPDSETISLDDSFFVLGGDSIQAMRLVGSVQRDGYAFTVADVFKHPTLADMATLLRIHDQACPETIEPFSLLGGSVDVVDVCKQAARIAGVYAEEIDDIYPCTPLQEGLLALTARRPGDYIAYNSIPLESHVDVERFKQAWAAVAAATPILRTRVVDLQTDGLVQVVVKEDVRWVETEPELKRLEASMTVGARLSHVGLYREADSHRLNFVWSVHHALYDAFTVALIMESVQEAYEGTSTPSLEPFAPFIKHLQATTSESAQTFWQHQFADLTASPFPTLPSVTYQPRADTAFECIVEGLGKAPAGMTMAITVRAAWALLIMQHTNSSDAVFGAVVSGRQAPVPRLERIAGPTIATVPVRVQLGDNKQATLQQLLHQVQKQAVGMTDYEQTGLQVIKKAGAEAEEACRFQTLLVVQPASEEDSSGADVQRIFAQSAMGGEDDGSTDVLDAFSTYALAAVAEPHGQDLKLVFGLDSTVVDLGTAKRMASQFTHILRQLCNEDNLHTQLDQVRWISDLDLEQIWKWNSQTTLEPTQACVHELFDEMVGLQPQAQAVYSHDGELTYTELDQLATRLAHHLISLGVGPGVIVPLLFEKSLYMPVAMLAVMKTGAASVGMDIGQPAERWRTIVKRSLSFTVMLASSQMAEQAAQVLPDDRRSCNAGIVITVGQKSLADFSEVPSTRRLPQVDPSSPLYIVFTSGSTGEPKGVVITHSNLASASKLQSPTLEYNKTARVFDFASYAFDAAWATNFLTLTGGGTVCIPSEFERKNDISGAMRRLRVTQATFTPTLAETLDTEVIKSLKFIEIGGEAVPERLVQKMLALTRVRVAYGPSEATIGVMFARKETQEPGLGYGVGAHTWICHPDSNRLVGIGCVGELWLEGPLIGQGYLNDTAKTNEVFISDPDWLIEAASAYPGRRGRLYKTGDLVSYNLDGSLVFHGRRDQQTKIRGQRVELGEIEHNVLLQLPEHERQGVQVVAENITLPQSNGRTTLLVFVKIPGSEDKSEHDLTSSIASLMRSAHNALPSVLPSYMVPNGYVALQTLPITATGKADRRRLQQMNISTDHIIDPAASINGERRAPSTPNELKIRELWASVLGVDEDSISAEDNFIRLGGDSIQAMRLVGTAHRRGIELTVRDVLAHPLLSDLAASIASSPATTNGDFVTRPDRFSLLDASDPERFVAKDVCKALSVRTEDLDDVLPATPTQKEFLVGSVKNTPVGIHWFYMDFPNESDVDRLVKSCDTLAQHFEILRTVFIQQHSRVYQIVMKQLSIPVEILSVPQGETMSSFSQSNSEEEHDQPPLSGDTFLRFILLIDSHDRKRLLIRLSHAYYDGAGLLRMWSTMQDIYNGNSLPKEPSISSLVALQRADIDYSYWNELLARSNMSELNNKAPKSGEDVPFTTVRVTTTISTPRFPTHTNMTAATFFTAACALMLVEVTSSSDVLFGRLVSGRANLPSELREIVFPCITSLPVRVCLPSSSSTNNSITSTIASQVHEQYSRGLAYETLSLEQLAANSTSWPDGAEEWGVLSQYQNLGANPTGVDSVSVGNEGQWVAHGLRDVGDKLAKSNTVIVVGVPKADGTLMLEIFGKSTRCDGEFLERAMASLVAALQSYEV